MLPYIAGACDEELHGQVLSYHRFPEGQHFRHPLARDRGLAMATRQSICDDAAHHKLYSLLYDITRLIISDWHPFLVRHERPSKTCPALDRLPAPDPQPDDKHNYK